jgi:hypothetical protein
VVHDIDSDNNEELQRDLQASPPEEEYVRHVREEEEYMRHVREQGG